MGAGVGSPEVAVTVADSLGRIWERLDEDAGLPSYWDEAEALDGLDEAQNVFVLLTLCLETSAPLVLQSTKCFYRIRGWFPDYLLPLKIDIAGVKIKPAKLHDLNARRFAWQATAGTPEHYFQLGLTLFGVTPQPAAPATATVTYAKTPSPITSTASLFEVPAVDHPCLVDYALYYLWQKNGGQDLERGLALWRRFLETAKTRADFVRARSRSLQYDAFPPEIQLRDYSREALKKTA